MGSSIAIQKKNGKVGAFRIITVLNLDQWKVIVDNHLTHLIVESVILRYESDIILNCEGTHYERNVGPPSNLIKKKVKITNSNELLDWNFFF